MAISPGVARHGFQGGLSESKTGIDIDVDCLDCVCCFAWFLQSISFLQHGLSGGGCSGHTLLVMRSPVGARYAT